MVIFCAEASLGQAPIEIKAGRLTISVDPRMELLGAVQAAAGYSILSTNIPYFSEVKDYFGKYSGEPAARITRELLEKHHFSYDAPVAMMLHLSDLPILSQKTPFSEYLIGRAGSKENLDEYADAIRKFERITNFKAFWDSHTPYYRQIVEKTASEIQGLDLAGILEDWFKESHQSYNIIVCPLFRGGYGPRIPAAGGKYNLYACLEATRGRDSIPYIDRENLISYVLHEFSHSFVNNLTDDNISNVNMYEKLYEPLSKRMSKIAYTDWKTCLNEHIIRAINIRFDEKYHGAAYAKRMLYTEKSRGFAYIEILLEKIKEYESVKDKENISFRAYYPRLISVFDSVMKTDYKQLAKIKFNGPLNATKSGNKCMYIYPTFGNDASELSAVKDYTIRVFNAFKAPGDTILPDTSALLANAGEYGIFAYGTPVSNLFLNKYRQQLPFSVCKAGITVGKEFRGEHLRLISCLPNPLNPELGMSVYTATDNASIPGINNFFHGGEDFVLYDIDKKVLARGYYEKEGEWKFEGE